MGVAIVVVILLIIAGVVGFVHFEKKHYDTISFKETLELTDLPIVTFHHIDKDHNDIKLNFLLDTGANRSIIDSEAIEQCEFSLLGKENSLCGIDGVDRKVYNVKMCLSYNSKNYREVFQVSDMSSVFNKMKQENGVTIHGILGNTFFNRYRYIIDFDKLIFYSKCKV